MMFLECVYMREFGNEIWNFTYGVLHLILILVLDVSPKHFSNRNVNRHK